MTAPDSPGASTKPFVEALRRGPFGLGTAPLAGLYDAVPPEQARAALRAAWDGGVRYYDTAPHYGAGLAERRLGEFLRTVPRAEAVVSTKVGRLLVRADGPDEAAGFADDAPLRRVIDFSADGVRRSLDESLRRSGLDRFDLVFIHDPDDHWEQAVGQAYPALARLRDEGVVRAIGVGMNQAEMLARFVRETDIDAVLVAGRYTLLDQRADEDLLPACLRRGVAVIAGGVFNSGILADPGPDAHYDYQPAPAPILARALAMQAECQSFGVTLPAAAVQFPRRHPAVTTVLVGARSAEEVDQDLALLDTPVPDELWPRLAER
ncbi:aldo/keto reductase [Rugosimonospora acidiphila]|uniref:Aldo/keto reductase n=1 Tax=Rugosimonospora acidiphila TaxID=556531 RepID=A0ABP9S3A3_9ACTN